MAFPRTCTPPCTRWRYGRCLEKPQSEVTRTVCARRRRRGTASKLGGSRVATDIPRPRAIRSQCTTFAFDEPDDRAEVRWRGHRGHEDRGVAPGDHGENDDHQSEDPGRRPPCGSHVGESFAGGNHGIPRCSSQRRSPCWTTHDRSWIGPDGSALIPVLRRPQQGGRSGNLEQIPRISELPATHAAPEHGQRREHPCQRGEGCLRLLHNDRARAHSPWPDSGVEGFGRSIPDRSDLPRTSQRAGGCQPCCIHRSHRASIGWLGLLWGLILGHRHRWSGAEGR